MKIEVQSFAKINLFLHIKNKRKDNYHNIETWYQFVNIKDKLTFIFNEIPLIKIESNLLLGKNNSISTAIKKIKAFAQEPSGLDIRVDKFIPMNSGLGGGSSNAATTLWILNKYWKCNLSVKKLMEIGTSIGADVPIFLYQHSSYATGIGNIFQKKYYPEKHILIIKAPCHCSTKDFFEFFDQKKSKGEKKFRYHNAFTEILFKKYPNVYSLLKKFFVFDMRLSGTGSCFFILHENYSLLKDIQKKLGKNIDSWITKTLNFAPIVGKIL